MGDLFILDLSIEYPLEYDEIFDEQYFFDKMKMNNSYDAYEEFILPIVLTNEYTMNVKMSLCSFSQVISSGNRNKKNKNIWRQVFCFLESTHTNGIQKRDVNTASIRVRNKNTFGPCQGRN